METIFENGSFIDYAGKEHKYTIAGVVIAYKEGEAGIYYPDPVGDWYDFEDDVYKMISIGISICNPLDKYDGKIGQLRAEGRAKKHMQRVVAFNKGGMCSEDAVAFFVNQTARALESNPGLFIAGYNAAAKKYAH